jgi:aquaporin Z
MSLVTRALPWPTCGRSPGPALVVGGAALSQVWLFIVAPLVGGVLAAGLHQLLYHGEEERLAAEAQQGGRAAAS